MEPLNIEGINSTPTIPLTDVARVRMTELASQLESALQQGYVEANLAIRMLDLLQAVLPLFLKA